MSILVGQIGDVIKRRLPHALYLWGDPGIGKSEAVAKAGREMGVQVFDVRVSQLDPTDLRGIPHVVDGRTRWAPPVFFPKEPGSILFLDEMNHAPQSVQSATYQLILEKRLGEYHLPPDTIVIAASNDRGSGMLGFDLSLPLKNRFIHFEVKHSYTDWREWAVRSGIAPEIISFLHNFQEDLHKMPAPDKTRETKAFPTPRSWTFVSDIFKAYNNEKEGFEKSITAMEAANGAIGSDVAHRFSLFVKKTRQIPDMNDIFADPNCLNKVTDQGLAYYILQSIAFRVEKGTAHVFQKACKVLEKVAPKDVVVFVIHDAVRRHDKRYLVTAEMVKDMGKDAGIALADAMQNELILPAGSQKVN